MPTCSLPYIQKLDVPQQEKTRLENLHFEIGRKLRAHQDNGIPTFILKKGYLRFNSPASGDYTNQLELLAELNGEYGAELVTERSITEYYDPGDGELEPRSVRVVGIDVRSQIDPQYSTSTDISTEEDSVLTGIGIDPTSFDAATDLATNLRDFALEQNKSTGEYQYVTDQHHELFQNTANSLVTKLEKYIDLLRDKAVDKPVAQVTIRELEEQLEMLKNPESRAQVEAVSNFIVNASGWLDTLYANFYEDSDAITKIQKELRDNINSKTLQPFTKEERDLRVNLVAKTLAKQKHYLYLFDELGRFQEALTQEMGFKPKVNSTYERGEKLLTETSEILKSTGVSPGNIAAVLEVLASPDFTEAALRSELTRVLSITHPDASASEVLENVEYFMQDVLDSYPGKTAESILTEALSKAAQLKRKLVDQHYELVTNWIYPYVENKQSGYTGEFKLDRDKVKALLQQASTDEGFFQYQLDATIQSSDPINAVVASIVSDQIYSASNQTQKDLASLLPLREALGNMDAAAREQYHKQFTHQNLFVLTGEQGGEVLPGDGWDGPVMTINTGLGAPRTVKAYAKESFLEEFNTSLYEATEREFFSTLPAEIDALWDKVIVGEDGYLDLRSEFLPYLLSKPADPYLSGVLKKLFFFSKQTGRYELSGFDSNDSTDPNPLRKRIKSAYTQVFFGMHQQGVSSPVKIRLFQKWGLVDSNDTLKNLQMESLPEKLVNSSQASKVIDGEEKREQLTKPYNKDWLNSLVSYQQGGKTLVLVRKTRYNMEKRESQQYWSWVDINTPGSFADVTRLYYAKNKLVTPGAQYHVTNNGFGSDVASKWNTLQSSDPVKLAYFKQLYEHYSDGNEQTGGALKHGMLPQIQREQSVTTGVAGMWERLWNWIQKHTLVSWVKDTKDWMSGDNAEISRTGKRTYLDNSPVHQVRVNYTKPVADTELEGDLFRSVMMWKAMSNSFSALNQINPQIQALRTLINGDTFLGISEREAKDVPFLLKRANEMLKQETSRKATNLNRKLTAFLDDMVYGDEEYAAQFMLGNKPVDAKKLAQKLSGFTAFSSLAWNVSSMAGNIGVGFLNNYSESVKGKYYQPEDWRAAWGNYWKHSNEFIKDLSEKNPYKRSKLTQLSSKLDAIQGEILGNTDQFGAGNNTDKLMNRALYWTQSGAEHWIQTISMESQMRGFKLASGTSLWDDVLYTPGEEVSFASATDQELRNFQQQLHSVNKQLHGHYSQFDKSMLQRHWIGQMLMMFKKYIYSSIRYRFGDKRYDWEAGDETEGHIRMYWKSLMDDMREEKNALRKAAVLGNGMLVKPIALAADQLVAGGISKLSPGASQYLYGDESEMRNATARQTGFDVLWYSLMVMMASVIHSLDDNDDPNGVFMQNMEAFARRMEGDLGMYLPFYMGTLGATLFSSYDKAWQLIKSPMAQLRAYDGSVNLLSQLIGMEYTEDGWDMSWNDTYSRDGAGYEKGDSKLYHKFERSVLGPLSQINRLANPEAQLQFLNLSRRNSQ